MTQAPDDLGVSVREALPSDVVRIVALALQLGYEVTPAHIDSQLAARHAKRDVLVAVVPRAGVVGFLCVSVSESFLADRRGELEAFVVEDEYRSSGVGATLLRAAERWARERGCIEMRLHSNTVRHRAHDFYLRNGYQILKSQYVIQKTL